MVKDYLICGTHIVRFHMPPSQFLFHLTRGAVLTISRTMLGRVLGSITRNMLWRVLGSTLSILSEEKFPFQYPLTCTPFQPVSQPQDRCTRSPPLG